MVFVKNGGRKYALKTLSPLHKRDFERTVPLEAEKKSDLPNFTAFGGIKRLGLLACLAVVQGIDMINCSCKFCDFPHVDDVDKFVPHRKHLCNNCGQLFFEGSRGVGNPLLPFLQQHVQFVDNNSFSDLQAFSIQDILTFTSSVGCDIS